MAEQFNQNIIAQKLETLSDAELSDVFNRIPNLEASRNNSNNTEDDLILSLQNRKENRRARQVFEWEATRRRFALQTYL